MYLVAKFIAWIFIHIRCRVKVVGKKNIPAQGGVILCSNHISLLDPIVMGVTVSRPIHFMAKKELFKPGIVSWFFKSVNAFPVDRTTTDLSSYKKAISLLRDGNVMGIFAQGTRIKDGDLKSAKQGTAMFALKAGVPVVPVGIVSSYKLFGKVKISYGEPIYFNEFKDKRIKTDVLEQVTEKITAQINALCESELV